MCFLVEKCDVSLKIVFFLGKNKFFSEKTNYSWEQKLSAKMSRKGPEGSWQPQARPGKEAPGIPAEASPGS